MPNTILKRRYKCKKGCGCKMCKPQKGGHVDHRTLQDVRADLDTVDQLRDFRSVAQQ